MIFDIVHQFYVRQSRSIKDDIEAIKDSIDPAFQHSCHERTIYMAMNLEDLAKAREEGLLVIEKEDNWVYVIQEITASFFNIPEEDYTETCDHLVEQFGKRATYTELRKTIRINPVR